MHPTTFDQSFTSKWRTNVPVHMRQDFNKEYTTFVFLTYAAIRYDQDPKPKLNVSKALAHEWRQIFRRKWGLIISDWRWDESLNNALSIAKETFLAAQQGILFSDGTGDEVINKALENFYV